MIDTLEIRTQYKIVDLVPNLKHSGGWHKGPCPMCGGVDRFNVKHQSKGDVWWCRHCSNDKYQDVIALVQNLNNCDFNTAVNILTGGKHSTVATLPPPPPKERKTAEIPAEQWQAQAYEIWSSSHGYFLGKIEAAEPDSILAWLMARGIMPKQIREYGLGFHAGGDGLPKGIVIPSFYDGHITYLKARVNGKPKYKQLKGGTNSLFNADRVSGKRKIIIVEGEFDCILLSRFVDNDTVVVTMGGAGAVPAFSTWGNLFSMAELFIFQDGDTAGQASADKWKSVYPYAKIMPSLGDGLDITDYWKLHGSDGLKQWLTESGVN
jgi:DNA primase